ncbi:hypothetical protein [Hymenobacter aerophilus]|uniref:hypothetical protein n=1 Tax=Hymenobacter aerophilus TaxID=119644 RepID=UPI00039F7189|nr:hypothetical protein [Hymenobacter aerophilus]
MSLLRLCRVLPVCLVALSQPLPAAAQQAVAPTPATFTRTDTLDAVTALFITKRNAAYWPLALALPGLRLMASGQRKYDVYSGQWVDTPASGGAVAAGLGLAGAGLGFMLARNSTYSMAKLNEFQRTYAAGAPLSPVYAALLRPRHFAKADQWREKTARKQARRKK